MDQLYLIRLAIIFHIATSKQNTEHKNDLTGLNDLTEIRVRWINYTQLD